MSKRNEIRWPLKLTGEQLNEVFVAFAYRMDDLLRHKEYGELRKVKCIRRQIWEQMSFGRELPRKRKAKREPTAAGEE